MLTPAAIVAPALPAARTSGPRVFSRDPAIGVIKHVVFVVQENRSFNDLFLGFPGATTQNYGYDTNGNQITLHAQALAQNWDIAHSSTAFFAAYDNGKLDGWNNEFACCGSIPPNFAYAYVSESDIEPYWQMAGQYVLADMMFQSNLDGSFTAHQYAIAAYANHEVNFPTEAWGCGEQQDLIPTLNEDRTLGAPVPVCEDYPTLGDELDTAGVNWRFYAGSFPDGDGGLWSAYAAINHVYNGRDWRRNVLSPSERFIDDVHNGKLAAVTWITPTNGNSDHPGANSKGGPRWVTRVVNAVGESRFWNSTAVFLIWDDWGGWFDPVAPIYEDYDGLGFRIPMIALNAYAQAGAVTHMQYETASVLRFIEDLYGLPNLAAADARAADPATDPAFDFSASPRPFKRFRIPHADGLLGTPMRPISAGGD